MARLRSSWGGGFSTAAPMSRPGRGRHDHRLVQRNLPGSPIPRKELIAEWEDLRRPNAIRRPVASFLFDLHYAEP